MTDETSNMPNEVVAESNRLSKAITKMFVDEEVAPEIGVMALAVSIGNALRNFSSPDDLEDNLSQVMETIRRVGSSQPASN